MTKPLIYVVAAACLALLGTDAYLLVAGKATPSTVVELCTGAAVILAIGIVALAKALKALARKRAYRDTGDDSPTLSEVAGKVDDLADTVTSVSNKADDIDSKVADIADTLDSRLGPEPDSFTPVILGEDENGKLVTYYTLPAEETWELAADAARESIQARIDEGNPVPGARWSVQAAYLP